MPALVFLCIGLAVNRYHRWRRDSGVVLLSGAGFTCFIIFTLVCLLMTDDFKNMMQPDALQFFSAYTSGTIFTLSVAIIGIILLKSERKMAEQSDAADSYAAADL